MTFPLKIDASAVKVNAKQRDEGQLIHPFRLISTKAQWILDRI